MMTEVIVFAALSLIAALLMGPLPWSFFASALVCLVVLQGVIRLAHRSGGGFDVRR